MYGHTLKRQRRRYRTQKTQRPLRGVKPTGPGPLKPKTKVQGPLAVSPKVCLMALHCMFNDGIIMVSTV